MANKKSQEAMEFLMTYGWALLASIIAIAVLVYFGVFNPDSYTSQENFTFCLEKFAKEYCDNNNFIFINNSLVNQDINSHFSCYIDDRTREIKRFYFLDKEIEECNGNL
jgi:capsule polysaccharide export protein KpsE/RkpR